MTDAFGKSPSGSSRPRMRRAAGGDHRHIEADGHNKGLLAGLYVGLVVISLGLVLLTMIRWHVLGNGSESGSASSEERGASRRVGRAFDPGADPDSVRRRRGVSHVDSLETTIGNSRLPRLPVLRRNLDGKPGSLRLLAPAVSASRRGLGENDEITNLAVRPDSQRDGSDVGLADEPAPELLDMDEFEAIARRTHDEAYAAADELEFRAAAEFAAATAVRRGRRLSLRTIAIAQEAHDMAVERARELREQADEALRDALGAIDRMRNPEGDS